MCLIFFVFNAFLSLLLCLLMMLVWLKKLMLFILSNLRLLLYDEVWWIFVLICWLYMRFYNAFLAWIDDLLVLIRFQLFFVLLFIGIINFILLMMLIFLDFLFIIMVYLEGILFLLMINMDLLFLYGFMLMFRSLCVNDLLILWEVVQLLWINMSLVLVMSIL